MVCTAASDTTVPLTYLLGSDVDESPAKLCFFIDHEIMMAFCTGVMARCCLLSYS